MTAVLFLTCHLPYPPESGGRRRELELIDRLGDEFDVEVCAVSKTVDEDLRHAGELRERCAGVEVFAAACAESLDPAPQVSRHACAEAAEHVAARVAAGRADLVHVEGFYLWQHVPRGCPVPTVLVEQNVEHRLWRQRARATTDSAARDRFLASWRATRQEEVAAWRAADVCAAVTEEDRRAIAAARGRPVHLVPDGADHLTLPPRLQLPDPAHRAPGTHSLLFLGNFGYQPNADAAVHLCRDVLPRVRAQGADAGVVLAGTSPPAEVRALEEVPGVVVTGRVPDMAPYLAAADLFVCPLRVGGGVKVKMLEALAAGKAIVSTPVGVQGLPAADGAAGVRVAGDVDAFADAVVGLLADPAARAAAGRAARAYVEGLPTWDEAAGALAACYRQALLLGGRRVRAAAG